MKQIDKSLAIALLALFVAGAFCYGQDGTSPYDAPDYRAFTIGFDPLQLVVVLGLLDTLILAGNMEYAITPNIGIIGCCDVV